MKKFILHPSAFILLFLAFPACDTTTGQLTPQGSQAITTGLGIAQLAVNTYFGIEAAKASNGGKVNTAMASQLAQNDLNGIAALAQANVGKTPSQANLSTGAANAVLGSAVQAALPQAPLTQGTVQTLFDAAAKVPTVAPAPASAQRQRRTLPTLYYAGRTIPGATIVTHLDDR